MQRVRRISTTSTGVATPSITWHLGINIAGASRQHRVEKIGRGTSVRQSHYLIRCGNLLNSTRTETALGEARVPTSSEDARQVTPVVRRSEDCLRQKLLLVEQLYVFGSLRPPGATVHDTGRAATFTSVAASAVPQDQDGGDRRPGRRV